MARRILSLMKEINRSEAKKLREILGELNSNLKIKLARIAIIRLEKGPAKEIIAASFLGCLRLKGSKGTGLPQPKPTRRKRSVPRGSRWERGLRGSDHRGGRLHRRGKIRGSRRQLKAAGQK